MVGVVHVAIDPIIFFFIMNVSPPPPPPLKNVLMVPFNFNHEIKFMKLYLASLKIHQNHHHHLPHSQTARPSLLLAQAWL